MYRKILLLPLLIVFFATTAFADNGLVTTMSHHDVKTTADRFEQAVQAKGLKLFARIDHAAGAQSVGQQLPPTILLIFGNPKVGTPLMNCARTTAIDLPQKALIWEDVEGKTLVTYNSPAYLAQRHDIQGCQEVLYKVSNILQGLVTEATQQ